MGASQPRSGNRRTRKLWQSIWATVVGFVVLAAFGYWLEKRRETDLRDSSEGVTAEFLHDLPAGAPELAFEDVTRELGIDMRHGPGPRRRTLPEDTGSGLAWGDYDGDGDFDLYIVNLPGDDLSGDDLSGDNSQGASNHLYRNDGSGSRFVDVTDQAGVGDAEGFGMGASFADYDNDGDVDLYVTNYGPNRLYRNLGDGRFVDVADQLGVAAPPGEGIPQWSIAAAWGDVDRDGRLDLYVTNYVAFDPDLSASPPSSNANWSGVPYTMNPNAFDAQSNRLYRQLPDGGFEDVGLGSGVSNPGGRSLAATLVDLDGDGWLDIYVANDVSPNALFHNLAGSMGEVFFEDWSAATGSADPRGSMGIAVTDLAGTDLAVTNLAGTDGLPDLFITHWVAQENALYQAVETPAGRLEYRDKVRELHLAEISTDRVGWGCAFLDLDLDGRADLVVANGSTLEKEAGMEAGSSPRELIAQPLFLFWHDGERFYNVAPAAGGALSREYVARGLAIADFDRDGDSDIAVSVNRGRPLVLRNDSQLDQRSLALRLVGNPASSIGARVTVESRSQPGQSRRQVHFWGADASFASGHAAEWIVGLGSATHADLAVRWADGRRVRIQGMVASGGVRLR